MKKILAVTFLFFGLFVFSGCNTQQGVDTKALESSVFTAVDQVTKGVWDKELSVESFDASLKAAKGTWKASDVWQWLAWQNTDATWQVLVSLDGFDCAELETIPDVYAKFFHDEIYKFSENAKYCYDHKK